MAKIGTKKYSPEDITKSLSALAIAAYVAGYLILSYNLSEYGLSPTSPFRPRVLETGLSAIILCAIPLALGGAAAHIPSRGIPTLRIILMRVLLLPILSVIILAYPGFARDLPTRISYPVNQNGHRVKAAIFAVSVIMGVAILIAAASLIAVAGRWLWKNYHNHSGLSSLILLVTSGLVTVAELYHAQSKAELVLFLWFFGLSSATCVFIHSEGDKAHRRFLDHEISQIESACTSLDEILAELEPGHPMLPQPTPINVLGAASAVKKIEELKGKADSQLKDLRSETSPLSFYPAAKFFAPITLFTYTMLILAAYANWIYPSLPTKVGGGQLVSVTIFQMDSGTSSKPIRGGLLDQSDNGYFLLLPNHDKALFVPKERVQAIYYADKAEGLGLAIN